MAFAQEWDHLAPGVPVLRPAVQDWASGIGVRRAYGRVTTVGFMGWSLLGQIDGCCH